ncbi:aminodeoxychorismate lyase [Niallia circulans]|uniref:endolytic transglycosylase MltG n=1 Tax=Shouchella clausii TaxID=79880 RepID=UPI000BA7D199|nr:endolytic transglycosylase MltG [Shouchella clausii]MCM3549718.1 endolytic transglycosylase MltG [Shouchella clausii]PAF14701.1 aminodeoxychorismate lyase [Shouchella clausii]SPU21615.1 aminodeoxychorismate lyase [Niallia circulans]
MTKQPKQHSELYQERASQAKTVRKIVFICVLILFAVILAAGIFSYFYLTTALKPMDEDGEGTDIEVTIPVGTSTSGIADILEEEGLIRNATFFRYYARYKNESDFQAGTYTLNTSMGVDDLIASLKDGRVVAEAASTITIPEGLNLASLSERLAEFTGTSQEEVMAVIDDEEYVKELIDDYDMLTDEILNEEIHHPLEGYLFPASYPFEEEQPPVKAVIEAMLDQMEQVYQNNADLIENSAYTFHELLTIGSIIEREAKEAPDRFEISGVLHNRLEQNMKLQVDPTVAYAQGEHIYMTTYDDLDIDSPYNTYRYEGLPPGPIATVREQSLVAAADPNDTDYLYFYARYNGEIIYNEDYNKHLEARDAYRHEWEEAENNE